MRRFSIPQNVQLVDPITDVPGDWVPWKRWFSECVLNDQRAGSTPLELARVLRLIGDVKDLAPGVVWDVEDEDWGFLKPIVEAPQKALGGPLLMAQLLAFPRAFLDAQHINDLKAKAEGKRR